MWIGDRAPEAVVHELLWQPQGCGWLAGASVRAARCGLVQSRRAACARPVPRMRSSTESYPARHRPRRDDRRHRATTNSKSVCLSLRVDVRRVPHFHPRLASACGRHPGGHKRKPLLGFSRYHARFHRGGCVRGDSAAKVRSYNGQSDTRRGEDLQAVSN